MQYTYQDVFSTAQNSFWTHWFWCLLVLLPVFVSPLPHQQNVSLWGVFSSRETKEKVTRGDWVHREGGAWRSCQFLVKSCWMLINHPSWNGQMCWKSLQKNSLKPNAASHNNTSWSTDTYGFLEHTPNGESLDYKGSPIPEDNSGFWGFPLVF